MTQYPSSFLGLFSQANLDGAGELSLLQRLLLVCDGTLTDMVQAAFEEPVQLVKLAVETSFAAAPLEELAQPAGAPIMQRRILLRGEATGRDYVYAESLIALDAVPAALKQDLVESREPIGRLWVRHGLETRKEMLAIWHIPATGESPWFGSTDRRGVLARRYRVFSAGRPIMTIAEYFPVSATA